MRPRVGAGDFGSLDRLQKRFGCVVTPGESRSDVTGPSEKVPCPVTSKQTGTKSLTPPLNLVVVESLYLPLDPLTGTRRRTLQDVMVSLCVRLYPSVLYTTYNSQIYLLCCQCYDIPLVS